MLGEKSTESISWLVAEMHAPPSQNFIMAPMFVMQQSISLLYAINKRIGGTVSPSDMADSMRC